MSADIRTVQVEEFGPLKYDADMPIGALRGLMASSKEQDIGGMLEALAGFVTEWPFKGDPSDASSWDGLRRSEFAATTKALMEDLGELGEE